MGGRAPDRDRRRARLDQAATAALLRFAERFELPVVGPFRRASALDGEHENYAGEIGLSTNPKLKARIEEADLVLLIGGRMSEAASQGYTLFDIPAPNQKLVHVHADATRDRPQLPSDARHRRDPAAFCAALEGVQPPRTIRWSAETRRHARTISPGANRRRATRAACN